MPTQDPPVSPTPADHPSALAVLHGYVAEIRRSLFSAAANVTGDTAVALAAFQQTLAPLEAYLSKLAAGIALTEAEQLQLAVSAELAKLTPVVTALVAKGLATAGAAVTSEVALLAARVAAAGVVL